ncbi:hypothetical protein B0H13DRAFT_2342335 [Mycena leptocephala]|nr:hypothetical protein B0H13DRAFT_2342335 [Mycena leptocephala]
MKSAEPEAGTSELGTGVGCLPTVKMYVQFLGTFYLSLDKGQWICGRLQGLGVIEKSLANVSSISNLPRLASSPTEGNVHKNISPSISGGILLNGESIAGKRHALFIKLLQPLLNLRYIVVETCEVCIGLRYDRLDESDFRALSGRTSNVLHDVAAGFLLHLGSLFTRVRMSFPSRPPCERMRLSALALRSVRGVLPQDRVDVLDEFPIIDDTTDGRKSEVRNLLAK